MLALTLIQPWGTAVARWNKDVENRGWPPPPQLIGQRFAIHAGKTADLDAFALFVSAREIDPTGMQFDSLPRGAVVATAQLAGHVALTDRGTALKWKPDGDEQVVRRACKSRWLVGEYGWALTDVFALPEPVPCRGFQRLWRLPRDVEALVIAQEGGRV